MTNVEPAPAWRNLAAWGAIGAGFYIIIVWSALVLNGAGMAAVSGSLVLAAMLGLGLIISSASVAFSGRNRALSLRTFRNFLIWNAVAIALCLLVIWGFSAFARAGALRTGTSEWVAATFGATLIATALLGAFATASAQLRAGIIDDEEAKTCANAAGCFSTASSGWPPAACC